jgi:molybdate transport system substrate-binding protein
MKRTSKIVAVAAIIIVAMIAVAAVMTQSGAGQKDVEITVFAAASLKAAFTEIGENYEAAHPGTKITYNFDGSANLKTQIQNGAPADVFASADWKNFNATSAAGWVDNSTVELFAKNRLVVIIPESNPGNIQSLADLADPGLKIVIGDSSVPVGNYTRTVLTLLTNSSEEFTEFDSKVMANVVSQESAVNNIVTKVALGEADAGIVYTTDASGAGSKVTAIEIPDEYNVIAQYPIGVLAGSSHSSEAEAFVSYILSAEGQAVLAKYGFMTVSTT